MSGDRGRGGGDPGRVPCCEAGCRGGWAPSPWEPRGRPGKAEEVRAEGGEGKGGNGRALVGGDFALDEGPEAAAGGEGRRDGGGRRRRPQPPPRPLRVRRPGAQPHARPRCQSRSHVAFHSSWRRGRKGQCRDEDNRQHGGGQDQCLHSFGMFRLSNKSMRPISGWSSQNKQNSYRTRRG